MKKSAIKKIYYNYEDTIAESKEYRDLLERISELIAKLKKSLNEEQKAIFMEIDNLEACLENEGAYMQFEKGFKLGFGLGLEINSD